MTHDRNFDTDKNNILSNTEREQVTGIYVNKTMKSYGANTYNISSLKGIENFTALESLDCFRNLLTELDISKNTALTSLSCAHNNLTKLDVSKNTTLTLLECSYSQLIELDVSKNTALERLSCYGNKFTNLDLSNCPKLNKRFVQKLLVSSDVWCNSDVTITWNDGTVTRGNEIITTTSSDTTTHNAETTMRGMTIIASIPKFTATRTVDVSIDKEIPKDSRLILVNNSEDLNGVFISDDENLKVSANFEAGRTYAPVIATESEETSGNSGGCNAGMFGIFVLFANIALLKNVRRL